MGFKKDKFVEQYGDSGSRWLVRICMLVVVVNVKHILKTLMLMRQESNMLDAHFGARVPGFNIQFC